MMKNFKQFENQITDMEEFDDVKKHDNIDYMAETNIRKIKTASLYIDELIGRDIKNIPDWVETKLARCAQDMHDLHEYFKSLVLNKK
ncbi:MAG: hypothetical protein ACOC2W_02690 [bacterium]